MRSEETKRREAGDKEKIICCYHSGNKLKNGRWNFEIRYWNKSLMADDTKHIILHSFKCINSCYWEAVEFSSEYNFIQQPSLFTSFLLWKVPSPPLLHKYLKWDLMLFFKDFKRRLNYSNVRSKFSILLISFK